MITGILTYDYQVRYYIITIQLSNLRTRRKSIEARMRKLKFMKMTQQLNENLCSYKYNTCCKAKIQGLFP